MLFMLLISGHQCTCIQGLRGHLDASQDCSLAGGQVLDVVLGYLEGCMHCTGLYSVSYVAAEDPEY